MIAALFEKIRCAAINKYSIELGASEVEALNLLIDEAVKHESKLFDDGYYISANGKPL